MACAKLWQRSWPQGWSEKVAAQLAARPENRDLQTNCCRKCNRYCDAKRKILEQVSNVHWHLLDLRMIETLDILERTDGVRGDEVDRNTFPAEPPRATNAVQVVLQGRR